VNNSTETITTLDTGLARLRCRHQWRTCRVRRLEAQRSMRPVAVVMVREDVEDALKMLVVQDQQPIETL
jgi:hypothetical protein